MSNAKSKNAKAKAKAAASAKAAAPRARPTRPQLAQLVEEFALNAYRMQAGRNIDSVVVKFPPDGEHPYFWVLMNPVGDFFPRALAVLAHATMEATVRNVLKLLHPTRDAAWLEKSWTASNTARVYEELALCGVNVTWADSSLQHGVEAAIAALTARRNRIAHHADLPSSEEEHMVLLSHVLGWCHAAVIFEAVVLKAAFPELDLQENEDLVKKIERALTDWATFQQMLTPPAPLLGANVGGPMLR